MTLNGVMTADARYLRGAGFIVTSQQWQRKWPDAEVQHISICQLNADKGKVITILSARAPKTANHCHSTGVRSCALPTYYIVEVT